KQIKAIIESEVDHKLLVPQAARSCHVTFEEDRTQVDYVLNDNSVIQLISPHEAYCLLDSEDITTRLLASYLEKVILKKLP
ncbi:hypothetical protein V6255_18200, partial [Psychromonas arctica]